MIIIVSHYNIVSFDLIQLSIILNLEHYIFEFWFTDKMIEE